MLTNKDYILIEKFIDRNLNKDEIVEFKERFNKNKEFAKEIKLQTDFDIALQTAAEGQKNTTTKKTNKTKIISINKFAVMSFAATFFLLIGISIFMITKFINTESKLSDAEKKILQKDSIIANINTVNDSLLYQIADLNNIIKSDTFNNETVIPEIIEEKKLIADLVIDKQIKLFDANTRSEENDSLNFYLLENKFSEAISYLEKKLKESDPNKCKINLNKGVVELKAYKYNKHSNKAFLDSAITHFSYTVNNCGYKFPYPAKLYLAYCYMFKENKEQTIIILQELVATNKPENEFVKQANEFLNILLSD